MNPILIKRIYEDASEDDGYRILVDRIWPRGISKERAHLDEWVKAIAPSTELRKWFDHKEERFKEFSKRYKVELHLESEELKRLKKIAETKKITLLYSAKDMQFNQAIVLRDILMAKR
jgi:uncharacterized protein YeaO (DUF488 family)